MKKILSLVLFIVFSITLLTSCNFSAKDDKTIVVGASITPHSEILQIAKDILKEEGYNLKIKEFDDYVIPNTATQNGELDANYFQHKPYLDNFNKENKTDLVSVLAVHYEPLGIYPGKTKSLQDLKDGAVIAIPNDGTNEARALLLLQEQGLIKLKDSADFTATILDIEQNPKKLKIKELNSAQIARVLPDVDVAVINGNYALQSGLNASKDALVLEDKNSESAKKYANILVTTKEKESSQGIIALKNALQSEKVKKFIDEKYNGAVEAIF